MFKIEGNNNYILINNKNKINNNNNIKIIPKPIIKNNNKYNLYKWQENNQNIINYIINELIKKIKCLGNDMYICHLNELNFKKDLINLIYSTSYNTYRNYTI